MNYQGYDLHMHVEGNKDEGLEYYYVKTFVMNQRKVKNTLKNNCTTITDIYKFKGLTSSDIKQDDS